MERITESVWVEVLEIPKAVLDELVDFVFVSEADPRGHGIEGRCIDGPSQVEILANEPRKLNVSR